MRKSGHKQFARILAVDPSTRGFGFVVLEANGRPVDWGIKELSAKGKRVDRELLRRLDPIIDRYEPIVIVLEDCRDGVRGPRALRMIDTIAGPCSPARQETGIANSRRSQGNPRSPGDRNQARHCNDGR
jgi:hypothetical protein